MIGGDTRDLEHPAAHARSGHRLLLEPQGPRRERQHPDPHRDLHDAQAPGHLLVRLDHRDRRQRRPQRGRPRFRFNTNGNWDMTVRVPGRRRHRRHGEPRLLDVVVGGPDTVKLGVHGHDDDCDFFDGLCSIGTGPGGSDGGSNSEADWATAWTSVNTLVSGPGESFSAPFSMSTSAYALAYDGLGHVQRHLHLIRHGPNGPPAQRPGPRGPARRRAPRCPYAVLVAALAARSGYLLLH